MRRRQWWLLWLGASLLACNEASVSEDAPEVEETCTTVCVEWGGPAEPFSYQRPRPMPDGPASCSGDNALRCPAGTECVVASEVFGAAGVRDAVCELRDSLLRFDVSDAEGAVDVELMLTLNGELVAEPDDDSGSLHDDPIEVWVRSAESGRDVLHTFAASTGVATMKLAPGEYSLLFDDKECGFRSLFIHREATLRVLGGGRATLDIVAAPLTVVTEVDGVPVTWGDLPAFGGEPRPGGGLRLQGGGGAQCTLPNEQRAPALVQVGEVSVNASVDRENIVGVLGPQVIEIGEEDVTATLRGESSPLTALLSLPGDWQPTAETFFEFEHESGLRVSGTWSESARVIAGRYSADVRLQVLRELAGGVLDAMNAELTWPTMVFPPEAALALEVGTVAVRSEGWEPQPRDRVVAEFGEQFATRLEPTGNIDGEPLVFRGLVVPDEARLYYEPSTYDNGRPLRLRAPAVLAEQWAASNPAGEYPLVAAEVQVRFPQVVAGEISSILGVMSREDAINLRIERVATEEFGWSVPAANIPYDPGPTGSSPPESVTLRLTEGPWYVRAAAGSSEGEALGGFLEVDAIAGEVEFLLGRSAGHPSVETRVGGEVVGNAFVLADGRIWWSNYLEISGAEDGDMLLGERIVH